MFIFFAFKLDFPVRHSTRRTTSTRVTNTGLAGEPAAGAGD